MAIGDPTEQRSCRGKKSRVGYSSRRRCDSKFNSGRGVCSSKGEILMIKIYHMPRARGLRVIWLCEEMGLPYEIVPVSFPLSEEYRVKNPAANVPFLEDDGGVAIHESIAIMLYLVGRYGPTPLM